MNKQISRRYPTKPRISLDTYNTCKPHVLTAIPRPWSLPEALERQIVKTPHMNMITQSRSTWAFQSNNIQKEKERIKRKEKKTTMKVEANGNTFSTQRPLCQVWCISAFSVSLQQRVNKSTLLSMHRCSCSLLCVGKKQMTQCQIPLRLWSRTRPGTNFAHQKKHCSSCASMKWLHLSLTEYQSEK